MLRRTCDKLRLRLRSLFRPAAVDQDLEREIRSHLDEEIAANVAAGLPADRARRAALVSFGGVTAVEEACRDTRRVRLIETIVRDLRTARRALARQRSLLVAATTSIALGTGANLTIVALASSLLLSAPTADRPDELVHIRMSNGSHVWYRAWHDLKESGALAGLAGYQFEQSINWRQADESSPLVPLLVTDNFFDVVRIPFARGRGFTAAESHAELNPRLVVVSHGFWQRRLNSDPEIVGRPLTINAQSYIVTGVLAEGVRSVAGFALAPEVYLPLSRHLVPSLDVPRSAAAQLVGRLHPGQSVAAGRAALDTVVTRLGSGNPDPEFKSIRDFAGVGSLAQARDFKELAFFFVILLIVSGLVLAIACGNVAGLLMASGLTRRREFALRLALGASRRRVIQQLLTESLLLTTAGTVMGAALAAAALLALSRVSLPLPLPIDLHPALDFRLAATTMALMVISTCATGIMPALEASRTRLLPSIEIDPRYLFGRASLRSLVVVGQVAVSVVLLVAALLFVRSLIRASTLMPGFDTEQVLVAQVSFVEGRQGPTGTPAIEDISRHVAALPGVVAISFSEGVPLTIFSGGHIGTHIRIDGQTAPVRVEFSDNRVSQDYFTVMGIALLRGRAFDAGDRRGATPVVVVNDEFVRRYFAGADPIGRRIYLTEDDRTGLEVIGVVANSKYRGLSETREPAVYEAILQEKQPRRLVHLLVRTRGAPETAIAPVRKAVLDVDGSVAVTLTPMRQALAFAMLPSRFGSILLGLLGVVGTILAMVGLFGIVSFAVSQRAAEIAIRMSLGASTRAITLLVVRGAGRLVTSGLVIGLALAWLVSGPLSAFLVEGVPPHDPISFAAAAGALIASTVAAISGPALRALRIRPSLLLKAD